ncbi:MAG TPA: molybdopterin-dependent oxidoreductase [Myxococcales bacterium]|nr:molybdopterin-dependent oxidoreductase [Myxococcales bacterium]
MSWIKDVTGPGYRRWEELYRNRVQIDRTVRSTHGVNCTGSCSWNVHVKNGVVALETQATDYPRFCTDVPGYEPRGCQRGISASWYVYSPLRVKHPYLRGALLDLWREAKRTNPDPVEAWTLLVSDPQKRARWQKARGKGGLRRATWDEALELIAAATLHTVKTHGADRVFGFSPIPAMSMLSFAGGSRFLQLLGGVNLSFYDWYCDLPNASPEIWGEQTDVAESADWFHSRFIVSMGSNIAMTRTPDAHFVSEARHSGAKFVVLSPDFSMTSKLADWWLPCAAGQDGAFWLAVGNVILKEFYLQRSVPFFVDYLKRFSDAPFLVDTETGRLLPASALPEFRDEPNADFKFLVWDKGPRIPNGSLGFRWQEKKGAWNLDLGGIDPTLHFRGEIAGHKVATVFDLLLDQYAPFTPEWQEKITGIPRADVVRFAREWANTAEKTGGKCSILIGAGVNQWYHGDLAYRAAISALVLCGCVGRNGGGLNHYVGQEKLAPVASWAPIAWGTDWQKPPRLQNAPSFHYVHTDQWRYEAQSVIEQQRRAVHLGWLPFFPQFDRNPAQVDAKDALQQLKDGRLRFAIDDPDDPKNWPRVWFIWRGNALQASAKGQEYFLRHYLGTSHQVQAPPQGEAPPEGKLDLVVDLNFRMDTTALYSDVVLPAATWYEKDDLSTTDMHSFIHPFQAAVPPCWESKSDWDAFEALAAKVSELAKKHLPQPVRDVVMTPLMHDTPAEMAQREVRDWTRGECDAVPGKTMPALTVVERDYTKLHEKFVSLGPGAKTLSAHGISWDVADFYDGLAHEQGRPAPSLATARDAAEAILRLAPETNGESAFRAYQAEERKVGLPLADLAERSRDARVKFDDIARQPRRLLDSPCWTGITGGGRTYSAYCLNVERKVPWRTLTGRQHFYLDHPIFLEAGEALPTWKPRPEPEDLLVTPDGGIELNYLTPHGKWSIHSTFGDNLRMLTLSRGGYPLWLSEHDAARAGIADNDWVEAVNDHGAVVARAVVSARVPDGICILYHSPERTIAVPKSPARGNRRAGGHNSLTRVRLKPTLMAGGYGQFTFALNYWGPTGNNRDTWVMVHKLEGEPRY